MKSFDKQKNEGIFADENGLEFKVTNVITYQTIDDTVMKTRASEEFYGGNLEGTTEEESNLK